MKHIHSKFPATKIRIGTELLNWEVYLYSAFSVQKTTSLM